MNGTSVTMTKERNVEKRMKFNILVIFLLFIALVGIGYGMGYVGDLVYNSDAITIER